MYCIIYIFVYNLKYEIFSESDPIEGDYIEPIPLPAVEPRRFERSFLFPPRPFEYYSDDIDAIYMFNVSLSRLFNTFYIIIYLRIVPSN